MLRWVPGPRLQTAHPTLRLCRVSSSALLRPSPSFSTYFPCTPLCSSCGSEGLLLFPLFGARGQQSIWYQPCCKRVCWLEVVQMRRMMTVQGGFVQTLPLRAWRALSAAGQRYAPIKLPTEIVFALCFFQERERERERESMCA